MIDIVLTFLIAVLIVVGLLDTTLLFLVLFSPNRDLVQRLRSFGRIDLLARLQQLFELPRGLTNRLLGPPGSFYYVVHVALLYYVFVSTLVLLVQPSGLARTRIGIDSVPFAIMLHVYILSNIGCDCASFAVSRRFINKICDSPQLTWARLLYYGVLDLVFASACYFIVVFFTNMCHAYQVEEQVTWSVLSGYLFDLGVIFRPYAVRDAGNEYLKWPWMFVIAVSTYGPTFVFASCAILGGLITSVLNALRWCSEQLRTQLHDGEISRKWLGTMLLAILAFLFGVTEWLFGMLQYPSVTSAAEQVS